MSEPLLAAEAKPTPEAPTAEATPTGSEPTGVKEQPAQEGDAPKTPAEEPADEGAPETYTFKLPEGLEAEVGQEVHDAYSEAARDLNLPQEQAQKMFERTMTALHTRAVSAQEQQTKQWIDTSKADAEIGGEKLDENLAVAQKAIKEFGSDGLRELLSSAHGIGNHPEVIRLLVRVGKAVSEDRFVGGKQEPKGGGNTDEALAKAFYPNTPR